jgi:RES domain-containing protein
VLTAYDGHSPSPNGDDGSNPKAKADSAVGNDEVMGISNQSILDQVGQDQKDDSYSDHQRVAEKGGEAWCDDQRRFVHEEGIRILGFGLQNIL